MQTLRENVLRVLRARLGDPGEVIAAGVNAVSEAEVLSELLERAVVVGSLEEFGRALGR